MTFETTFDINRPAEAVYGYATDPLKFPEWQPDVESVEWEGAGGRVGSRFMTRRRVPGGVQSYTQEVVEQTPFRSWAVRGVEGMLRPSARVVVEPIDNGMRSRATFSLDYEATGVGRLILPFVERATPKQAGRSYARLKQILEGGR